MTTPIFNNDAAMQAHARTWAVRAIGENAADLFVSWLCALSDDDQHRVYTLGYPAVRSQFEQDFTRCADCGDWHVAGQSCICFDNHCQ